MIWNDIFKGTSIALGQGLASPRGCSLQFAVAGGVTSAFSQSLFSSVVEVNTAFNTLQMRSFGSASEETFLPLLILQRSTEQGCLVRFLLRRGVISPLLRLS